MRTKFIINKESKLFYLIGIFSTMTALSVKGVSFFYLLLLWAVLIRLFKGKIRFTPQRSRVFILLLLTLTVSMIISLFNNELTILDPSWKYSNFKNWAVFFILMGGITFLYSPNERKRLREDFLQGLYISSIVQLIWGIVQALSWYVGKISINELVFRDILKINLDVNWTFTNAGMLRLSGISWEPAYFSMTMVVGYLLSNRKIIKFLFILLSIISTSRTGLVIMSVAIAMDAVLNKKNITINQFCKVLFMFFVALIAFGIVLNINSSIKDIFVTSVDSLINWKTTMSGRTHFHYILYIPDMIRQIPLGYLLFGYGHGASGFPYMIYHRKEFGTRIKAWSVESDYVNALWGMGIIGLVLYYWFILKSYQLENDIRIKKLIVCLLVGGVFYIYLGTWIIFLLVLGYDELNYNNKEMV